MNSRRKNSQTLERAQGTSNIIRITDKSVQAEMKNKREVARYQLNCKLLDKQSTHTIHLIDKEKKISRKFLSDMRTTTGQSTEGLAPRGPWDREHEKSPYFHNTTAMSEKRRRHWRITEAQIQKDLNKCQDETTQDKLNKESPSQMKEKIEIVMGMMGYEDGDIEKMVDSLAQNEHKTTSGLSTVNGRENKKVKSLTEMTKKSYTAVPDVFECLRSEDELREERDEISKIKSNDWLISEPLLPMRKPKYFSIKNWEKSLIRDYTKKMTSSSNGIASADNSSEANKCEKSNAEKQDDAQTKQEYVLDEIPEENVVLPIKIVQKHKLQRPHSSGSLHHDQISQPTVPRPKTACELNVTKQHKKGVNFFIDNTTCNEIQYDQDWHDSRSKFLEENVKTGGGTPLQNTSKKSALKFTSSTSMLEQAVKRSNSEDPTVLKSVSFTTQTKSLPKSIKRTSLRRASFSAQTLRRQKRKSSIRMKSPPLLRSHSCGDEPEEQNSYTDLSYLPRWQRDLLREAPELLNTPKAPVKVAVVMSKSQRRKELQILTDREQGNLKRICYTEADRRRRSRANIFVTMMKVKQAVDTMKQNVETSKNISKKTKDYT